MQESSHDSSPLTMPSVGNRLSQVCQTVLMLFCDGICTFSPFLHRIFRRRNKSANDIFFHGNFSMLEFMVLGRMGQNWSR